MKEPDAGQFTQIPVEEIQRELGRLREVMSCDMQIDEWLGGGMSGGPVAVVTRSGPGFDDKVAIKFASSAEIKKWQQAVKDCPPAFRQQHLVDLEFVLPSDASESGWWIATLKIAGGDLSLIRPWAELKPLRGKSFATSCAAIVKSLIGEWNPAPLRFSLENIPPAAYLNSIFDAKKVTAGKPLRSWLDSLGIDLSNITIRRPGWREILPNPLALAATLESEAFCNSRPLRVLFGRAHGDLHLGNVLMQVRPPQPRAYKLIDLGGYSPKSPLARDPMHLLLSIAIEWLKGGIVPGKPVSHTLIDLIVLPRNQSPEKEYQEVSNAIHAAGHSWASASSLGDEWTRQSLLSLVGCGLLYASRQIPGLTDATETRGWFFDLAAVAARAYLEDVGLWERYVDEHSSPSTRSGPPNTVANQPTSRLPDPYMQSPSPVQSPSEVKSDECTDAQVLPFPPSSTRNSNCAASSPEPSHADERDQLEDLADALRLATFDPSDWLSLAAGTGTLLRQIQERYAMHPSTEEDIDRNLRLLDQTLTGVLRSSVTLPELRAAATRAEILRNWLLDLLADAEQ